MDAEKMITGGNVQATITSTRCALSVFPALALSPFRDSQRQPETDQRQPQPETTAEKLTLR